MPERSRSTKKQQRRARRRSGSLSLSNSSNNNESPTHLNNIGRDPVSHLRIRIPALTNNILALSPYVPLPIVLPPPPKPPSPVSRLALAIPTPRLKRRRPAEAAQAAQAPAAVLLPPPSNTAQTNSVSYRLGNVGSPAIPPPSYEYPAEQRAALAQLREEELLGKKGGSTRKIRRSRTRK